MPTRHVLGLALLVLVASPGCRDDAAGERAREGRPPARAGGASPVPGAAPPGTPLEAGPGVDVDARTVSLGALHGERGPAAWLGQPYAKGLRALVEAVDSGAVDALPEGWSVRLVEREHGLDPAAALEAFREIQPEILAVAASFGTPTTQAIRPALERAGVVAFPGSFDASFARHALTPPLAPSCRVEAMRAMDWAVREAGGAEEVRAGAIYQDDAYGRGALEGWQAAAERHGVALAGIHAVEPGQEDYAAPVAALQRAGVEYVLLATLPGTAAGVLGTAAQLQYPPYWLGTSPAWSARFFDPDVMPPAAVARFRRVSGLPYPGEEIGGMEAFRSAWAARGEGAERADPHALMAWTQGLLALEVARRAIERGDVTREGYRRALGTLAGWDAGGLIQPLDLSEVPYRTSGRVRVLRPRTMDGTWEVVGDWAVPASANPSLPNRGIPE